MCIDCSLLSRKASSLELKNCYAEHQFVLCTSKMKDGWNDLKYWWIWSYCTNLNCLVILRKNSPIGTTALRSCDGSTFSRTHRFRHSPAHWILLPTNLLDCLIPISNRMEAQLGSKSQLPTNRPVVALGGPWVHVKKKGKRQLVGDLVATHICDICGF